MNRLAIVLLVTAACGGSKVESDEPEPTAGSGSGSGSAREPKPAEINPEIDAFHTALAPRWHAVGPTRMSSVCAALADLQAKAVAVRGAGAPAQLDEEVWGNAMTRLETSLAKMKAPCGGTNTTAFESAFNEVHLAFHDYMDLVVGNHGHGQGDRRGGRRGIR